MLFSYTAVDKDGVVAQGVEDSPTKEALAHKLSSAGKTPIEIAEEKKKKKLSFNIVIFNRVPAAEKIAFAKNVGAMLKAGLPLSRALSVIERQTKNPLLKKNVSGIIADINGGSSFTQALEKRANIFPRLFIAMVRVGEETGSLALSLAAIAFQMGKSDSIVRKVRGAMIYPAIILTIMIVIFILIMTYVVPTLVATFTQFNVALPLPTQVIIVTSNILSQYLVVIIAGIFLLIAFLLFVIHTSKGKRAFDWLMLRIPFVKTITLDTNCALVTRTIGELLSAGVDMVETLKISQDVAGNTYFKNVLSEAAARIQKGEALSAVLRDHADIYPVYIGETVLVGEETGDLAGSLDSAAEFYETDVEEKTKNISVVIEPAIMVVVGIAVGFFAIAVISPIYSLVNVI